MTLPDLDPGGYRYRGLKEGLQGWDVWALQSALSVQMDGAFGPKTHAAVIACQRRHRLVEDGIAGVMTQRVAALDLLWPIQRTKKTPPGLMRGQVEAESSFWLGNHSTRYKDGSFDIGVCQRNTDFIDYSSGFNVPASLTALAENLRGYFERFEGVGLERRWRLAAAAWNAPAFASYLAREEGASGVKKSQTLQPSAEQRQALEAYAARVSIYM